ncbi:bifunctional oligoribonuclease/PAP phosphatase NrnA [Hydrogenimonas thermophila]|nr:bifunctional oligoribonuclease/PAP phosphatase NrnA [Hydrogenimonas thermophila]WOE72932.1 bifunctional oligoribonuclease/PAP phosphatase NrnA [Hydrogenimonas thermophila]
MFIKRIKKYSFLDKIMPMNYNNAKELIEKSSYITIVGHINPDPDTLGSGLGLWWVLKKLQKRVDAVYVSRPLPQFLSWMPGFDKIKSAISDKTDLIISVDCGSFDRLGIDIPLGVKLINIDHHQSNSNYGDINIIEPEFASASEVVYKLVSISKWPMPKEAAENFYTALVSDTGFFSYEGVDKRVFEFAKELIEYGVKPDVIARNLKENEPLSKLRLLPLALQTLKLYLNAKVAGLEVTQKMFEQSGATVNDTDDLVNYARSLATVEVGFLIREESDGSLKVSLRSKNYVNVSKIAESFGGGGHVRAAGYTVRNITKDNLVNCLLDKITKEL